MSRSFLPTADAELLAWSANFSQRISAAPKSYGLEDGQANAYQTAHNAYAAAYQKAYDPQTRTPPAIKAKDAAKRELDAMARRLVRLVQTHPGLTNAQRRELKIILPKPGRTPVPLPAEAPALDVVALTGRTVHLRLHAGTIGGRRGKPAGVAGASLFSYVGDAPPDEVERWVFRGSTSRTTVEIPFDAGGPAATVWITAFWFNRRGESGPSCAPIQVNLPAGSVVPHTATIKLTA